MSIKPPIPNLIAHAEITETKFPWLIVITALAVAALMFYFYQKNKNDTKAGR